MSRLARILTLASLAFLVSSSFPLEAQESLTIATKQSEPFSMLEGGQWRGLSIELWERVAAELDLKFTYEEMTVEEMLEAVKNNEVDAAVAALTVTVARKREMEFAHPIESAGLAIATRVSDSGVLGVLKRFLSWDFLSVILGLLALIGAVGVLLWAFERRKNPEEFGGQVASGVGAGMWWSAVTMTTVGYGDKSPRSFGGRLVALVWMFASILIISTFTAAIASSLTVSHLEGTISGPQDLPGARIGTVGSTTSAGWLDKKLYRYRTFDTVRDAMVALEEGELDAVVYDAPILRYLATHAVEGVQVLPHILVREDYAFAFPKGSPILEEVSLKLLEQLTSEEWGRLKQKYLGG